MKRIGVFLIIFLLLLLCGVRVTDGAPERSFVRRHCTAQEAQRVTPSPDGFCYEGWWVEGIVSNATHWHQPPTHFMTRALAQDEGVLEATVALKDYDTTDVQGLISLLSPSVAGWRMHVRFPTRPEWGWMLVLNGDTVEQDYHYPHVIINESGLELSGWLHKATGNIDYWDSERQRRFMMVEVCISMQPEIDCAGAPVDFVSYWKSFAQLEGR